MELELKGLTKNFNGIDVVDNVSLTMKNGVVRNSGDVDKIISSMSENVWKLLVKKADMNKYIHKYKISNLKTLSEGVELRILSNDKPAQDAVLVEATLEDVFLGYFGEKAGD